MATGSCSPLGPLRAPLEFQFQIADAIVLLGGEEAGGDALEFLRGLSPAKPVFKARIAPTVGEDLRERRVVAFCGIGRPAKFFETLHETGAAIVRARSFGDHHPYTEADARLLLGEAKAMKAALITTEKDAARLKGGRGALAELFQAAAVLPVAACFQEEDEAALVRLLMAATGAEPETSLGALPLQMAAERD